MISFVYITAIWSLNNVWSGKICELFYIDSFAIANSICNWCSFTKMKEKLIIRFLLSQGDDGTDGAEGGKKVEEYIKLKVVGQVGYVTFCK